MIENPVTQWTYYFTENVRIPKLTFAMSSYKYTIEKYMYQGVPGVAHLALVNSNNWQGWMQDIWAGIRKHVSKPNIDQNSVYSIGAATCVHTWPYSRWWSFANSISTRICLMDACKPANILADTEKDGHVRIFWKESKLRPLGGVFELSMCCHAIPCTRSRLLATTIFGTGNCVTTWCCCWLVCVWHYMFTERRQQKY